MIKCLDHQDLSLYLRKRASVLVGVLSSGADLLYEVRPRRAGGLVVCKGLWESEGL